MKDHAEAVRWFHLAVEQGHAGPQYYLGHMFFLGHGVAERFMFHFGRGVAQDDAEAARSFCLAAAEGRVFATAALQRLRA